MEANKSTNGRIIKRCDVLVLGAGPGGYVAAVRASQLGLSTAIVERRFWGGVCLNVGCIPSKALLHSAALAREVREHGAESGLAFEKLTLDYRVAHARSRKVADGRARGVRYLMRKNAVAEYEGNGRFLDAHTLEVERADGSLERLEFAHAVVATGASPRWLPGVPRGGRVVGYEEQLLSSDLPERVIVVGAGAIGVEMTTLLATFGANVTLLEAAPRVLPAEDEEAAALVAARLRRDGVRVLTSANVTAVVEGPSAVAVDVRTAAGVETLQADRVLLALGFVPNVSGYGLKHTGVALTERGAIATDPWLETSVPHIYAIGDVTGRLMLAHAAEAMALVAVDAIAGRDIPAFSSDSIPRVTFSHPQVAAFGLSEADARARGIATVVAKFPFQANGKAQGIGAPEGFAKLVTRASNGELLGAGLVGTDVAELLPELTLAHQRGLSVEAIADNVHAHPTLGEAVKDAAHGALGHFINL